MDCDNLFSSTLEYKMNKSNNQSRIVIPYEIQVSFLVLYWWRLINFFYVPLGALCRIQWEVPTSSYWKAKLSFSIWRCWYLPLYTTKRP